MAPFGLFLLSLLPFPALLNGLFDGLFPEILVALLPRLTGCLTAGANALAYRVSLGLGGLLVLCAAGLVAGGSAVTVRLP